jgi:DNA helicase-4
MLVDVLRGSESKKLLAGELNRVDGYGKLTSVNREDLTFIIEWLISNGFILQTKGQYPVLHPTNKGLNYNSTMNTRQLQTLKRGLEQQSI